MLEKRHVKVAILLVMHQIGICSPSFPILLVQLLVEREKIIRDLFIAQLRAISYPYFRVPPSLTHENLAISFKFYSHFFATTNRLQ
jgi:hypothetical protein